MCYECWVERGSPSVVNDRVRLAAKIVEASDHYGPLHIAVEDWNLDDESLLFCAEDIWDRRLELSEMATHIAIAGVSQLSLLTEDERYTAMAIANGYLSLFAGAEGLRD